MKEKRLTTQHKRNISKAMRGKNKGARPIEVRAAISATKRARDAREWRRMYAERMRELQLVERLAS